MQKIKNIFFDMREKDPKLEKIYFHILAVIAIVIFCLAISPKMLQNDTFYTIKIGEVISENGIDMKDHFSWHEDLSYTYPHWLYDLGVFQLFNLGESTGIENGGMLFIYISTCVLTVMLGLLVYMTGNKLCKHPVIVFILTLGAMYLMKPYLAARAQLVTFNLFVLEIFLIESFLSSGKKRYLIGLPIISTLIANIHAAVFPMFFIFFLPYIGEFLITWFTGLNLIASTNLLFSEFRINRFNKKIKSEKVKAEKKEKYKKELEKENAEHKKLEEKYIKVHNRTEERRKKPYKLLVEQNNLVVILIIVMIICIFTGFLTPIGDTPYTYLVKTMEGNTTKSISEHQPLQLIDNKVFMAVISVMFVIMIFTDTKIKLRDFFMFAGLLFMCFMSRRQISLFVIVCVFFAEKMLESMISKYGTIGLQKTLRLFNTIIGKIIVLGIVALIAYSIYNPGKYYPYINSNSYPVEACDWILKNLPYKEIKLYNEYNYGSYLLYRGIPVFIDSRADLYAPEFNGKVNALGEYEERDIFSDYINVSTISAYYENTFDKYEITHVICYSNAKLNMFLKRDKNRYNELYKDEHFVIYERLKEKENLEGKVAEKSKNNEAINNEQNSNS